MLEDFIVAIRDINQLTFKVRNTHTHTHTHTHTRTHTHTHTHTDCLQLSLAETLQDYPQVSGSRYKVCVEVPVQQTLFRLLPAALQSGKEISVRAVLFTQGVNEQQTISDKLVQSTQGHPLISPSLQVWRQYTTGSD